MADQTITRQVSERYARVLATGEQMCCPTSYIFEDLRRFAPEEVLGGLLWLRHASRSGDGAAG